MQLRSSRVLASAAQISPAGLACRNAISASLAAARLSAFPFPPFTLTELLPPELTWALAELPLAHPATAIFGCAKPPTQARQVFGAPEVDRFTACQAVTEAFGSTEVVDYF